MTIHLVTFSDESMSRSAKLCVESAKRHGIDQAISYSHRVLKTTAFYDEHRALLERPRGCGYFAWKPYVIHALMNLPADLDDPYIVPPQDGDYVIYSDAGIEFVNTVYHVIDRMDWYGKPQNDIFLFGNNWEHAHWCKRDVIDELWSYPTDLPPPGFANFMPPMKYNDWKRGWDLFGKQAQASVIFFRVSDYTRAFVAEWLKWCLFEGGRLIDDSPSRLPNHPEFREHRHDQAILTTLAYREGIKLHYWPAQYNDGAFSYEKLPKYANDNYPIMFHHHRRRNHEWESAA